MLVGPHWQNFADTYSVLIKNRGAIVVRSAEEIASAARRLLSDEAELDGMRTRASAALATISGALPRTIEALLRYLPSEEGLGACVLTSRLGGIANRRARMATLLQPLAALYGWAATARYWRVDAVSLAAAGHLRRQFHGRRHRQDAAGRSICASA